MKRSVFVVSVLCSMELFMMGNNLLDAHAVRNRTYSNLVGVEWGRQYPGRVRSFSETPQEILDMNARKDREVLEKQRIKIMSDSCFHKNSIKKKLMEEERKNRTNLASFSELKIGDFICKGKAFVSGEFGAGKVIHKNKIAAIHGYFYKNFLDLSKRVKVAGVNRNKTYVFVQNEWVDDSRYCQLISIEDISRVTRSIPYDGSLCLRFDGGEEGIVFNPEFVYKGTLANDEITGKGVMVTNTGEILEGRFYRGIYKGEE